MITNSKLIPKNYYNKIIILNKFVTSYKKTNNY